MPTDTSERGLESLIVDAMTGRTAAGASTADADGASVLREVPAGWDAGLAYVEGDPADYDRAHCIDLKQLLTFIETTQPEAFGQLGLGREGPSRDGFLARLQGEIAKRGIIDVLRRGVQHHAASVQLFYGTPTTGNAAAAVRFSQNIFSVTRQLRYSLDATRDALDLGIFINGLPVATFELKNRLTGQTVEDAVLQYQRDRDPREPLFQFKRCLAHFAVDDQEVRFCTRLAGKDSWFLPFNKGWKDGAGNPPNPDGIKTDYLWREVLTREGLADIVENYAQVVAEEADKRTGRKRREEQIFPRYHQLDVVRKLLAVGARGGAALPDPALGGQRQEQLDRLAGAPARRLAARWRGRWRRRSDGVRFGDRRDGPRAARQAAAGHDQAVLAGRVAHWARRALGPTQAIHRGTQEDCHHDGAEVPGDPERYWRRPSRPPFRDHHR